MSVFNPSCQKLMTSAKAKTLTLETFRAKSGSGVWVGLVPWFAQVFFSVHVLFERL